MLSTIFFSVAVGTLLLAFFYKPTNSKKGFTPFKQQTADELPDYKVKRVTRPDEVMEVRVAKSGIGAAPPATVVGMLEKCRDRAGSKLAMWHEDMKGNVRKYTWAEVFQQSAGFAKALIALGLRKCEISNIIGYNMPEWFFAEWGTMLAGAIPAGVYTTSNAGSMAYIASQSKAQVIVAESKKYLERYATVKRHLSTVKAIVVWTEMSKAEFAEMEKALSPIKLYSWDGFLSIGEKVTDEALKARMNEVQPGNIGSLIYTSGTTGNPKAVMCSHDAMVFEALTLCKTSEKTNARPGFTKKNFSVVSYLPLNHAAAKVTDMLGPLFFTQEYAAKGLHGTIYISRPDAMKGSLAKTLQIAKPTIFFGVPRVWEKMMEKMLAAEKKSPAPLKKITAYGKSLGRKWFRNSWNDGDGSVPYLWPLFNHTIFALVRQKLGLDNCMVLATGAAPIKSETLQFFGSMGMPICNTYGMSENMGAGTFNFYNNYGFGSAGFPFDGLDIKIKHDSNRDKPGHGEILVGGRANMAGYMYEDAKTRATIDENGYIRSGDIGMLKNGCLYITGRIKDLIIGAGGENIAPVPIENHIATTRSAISNIVMIGNQRKYNVCLISLKSRVDPTTGIPSSQLSGAAKAVDPACKSVEEAMKSKKWEEYLTSGITDYNDNPTVCVSRASKIQKFRILPVDLNVPEGTLGPTLKVKRGEVEKKYHDLIETMYS